MISEYWRNLGKTEADKKPGRTYEVNGELRCNECCNGDRCDDPTHRLRINCSYCLGTGVNATTKITQSK
jgi:hypothetical protein